MKKIFVFTISLCLGFSLSSYGRTALKKAANKIDVSVNFPLYLKASHNKKLIYATPVTKTDSVPTSAQLCDSVYSYGSNAFKVYFPMLHSIVKRKSGKYVTFVYVSDGTRTPGASTDDAFDRIKADFRFGSRFGGATEGDRADLDLMLTHYPREKAREMFNADWMVMYPMHMGCEVYKDKYSRCRAVLACRDGVFFVGYFLMPEKTHENFDEYLNELKGVFWFNDLQ